jgi:hypothetical protein
VRVEVEAQRPRTGARHRAVGVRPLEEEGDGAHARPHAGGLEHQAVKAGLVHQLDLSIFDDEDGDRGLALAGALAARLVLPAAATDSIGGAVTHPAVSTIAALALEAGMTGLLLAVVLAFVSSQRLARWAPLALVPVIAAIIWLGSPWTGASLNPARSEGPAVAFGDLSDLWLYLFAPSLGALAVAALWRRRPMTAKLFHDPRYPCPLRSELRGDAL